MATKNTAAKVAKAKAGAPQSKRSGPAPIGHNNPPPNDLLFDEQTPVDLGEINRLAMQAATLQEKKENLLEMIAAIDTDLGAICRSQLPEALMKARLKDFTMENGAKVELSDILSGSLPKEDGKRKKALEWIVAAGAGDIIKRKIAVVLGKGTDKTATRIAAALEKIGVDYENKMDVHAQTLLAFVRERLAEGLETPLDVLGIYKDKFAKIILPDRKNVKPPKQRNLV